ncbi:MAG: hypothetical protein ACE3JQ_09840 [Paenisporosarcina sp.]
MALYDEFINIAKALNKELDIVPILYGSLGLEKVTRLDFNPQDIDILVPLIFFKEKWNMLLKVIEELGYELVDLHEHEFRKNETKIGIAFMEDLKQFADIDYESLMIVEDNGAKYHSLTISDYIKVYNKSLLDGYRRSKNNKDQSKLKILYQLVQN